MVVSMLMLDFEEIGRWNVVGLLSDVMDGFELPKTKWARVPMFGPARFVFCRVQEPVSHVQFESLPICE